MYLCDAVHVIPVHGLFSEPAVLPIMMDKIKTVFSTVSDKKRVLLEHAVASLLDDVTRATGDEKPKKQVSKLWQLQKLLNTSHSLASSGSLSVGAGDVFTVEL